VALGTSHGLHRMGVGGHLLGDEGVEEMADLMKKGYFPSMTELDLR